MVKVLAAAFLAVLLSVSSAAAQARVDGNSGARLTERSRSGTISASVSCTLPAAARDTLSFRLSAEFEEVNENGWGRGARQKNEEVSMRV